MTRRLTNKQEKFCQLYIESGIAADAYRGSYDTSNHKENTIHRNAHKLLNNDKVLARIGQLQEKHAERHNITIDFLTEKYLGLLAKAENENKIEAGKGILDSLGKLHGLMVDKKQVNGNIRHNHTSEPVHETLEWVGGIIRGNESRKTKESLPN